MPLWVRTARNITILAGAISAGIAALIALANGIDATEPFAPATRGFVRDVVANASTTMMKQREETNKRLLSIEISSLQSEQRRLEALVQERENTLQVYATTSPAELRSALEWQIQYYKSQLDEVNARHRVLREEIKR